MIAILVLVGLALGSFVNALVWRLHEQSKPAKQRLASSGELSISKGRSMCVHCGHTLSATDLIPVFSWLALRGKCRYCKKSISWQYPAVELLTALLFVGSYVFWPESFTAGEIFNFIIWLICLPGLVALMIYDIRWMILPNKIIFPLTAIAAFGVVADAVFSGSFKIIVEAAVSVLIAGGIFFVLFQLSRGKWIGGGDVKLGFLLGLLAGKPILAFLTLFGASVLGTLAILPFMIIGKITSKNRIPFGPFLIISAITVRLFGDRIADSYFQLIGL
jgi:prepilin signal peptidase PulO-like enzyme (type II secretory pathway)